MTRPSYTPAQRDRIFADGDGKCIECGCDIDPSGPWHVGHRRARGLLGSDEPDNLGPSCVQCNMDRAYKVDIPAIAQAKRMAGETGQYARRKRNGSKIRSGPMPGTRKSGLRKKFDGTVERWKT